MTGFFRRFADRLERLRRQGSEPETGGEDFGCARCWPDRPAAAWKARNRLARETELVDESHFHVMTLACGSCGQRFVSVFTETIDWVDGDDPQYWTLMPRLGSTRWGRAGDR